MVKKKENDDRFNLKDIWISKILYLIKAASEELKIPLHCRKRARMFTLRLKQYSIRFSGKKYGPIAGAIIYICSLGYTTQKEISSIVKCTIPTLRKRIKDIRTSVSF